MEELDQNMRIMRLFRRCHAIVHSKMCGGKSSQSEILRILHRITGKDEYPTGNTQ